MDWTHNLFIGTATVYLAYHTFVIYCKATGKRWY